MRKFRNIVLLAFIFPFWITPAYPNPLNILDSDKINDVLDRLNAVLQYIIVKANGETRSTLIIAYQDAIVLVQNLKSAYDDSLQKTIGTLDTQQRKAFEDANNFISRLGDVRQAHWIRHLILFMI
jgi:hypothetical protein